MKKINYFLKSLYTALFVGLLFFIPICNVIIWICCIINRTNEKQGIGEISDEFADFLLLIFPIWSIMYHYLIIA